MSVYLQCLLPLSLSPHPSSNHCACYFHGRSNTNLPSHVYIVDKYISVPPDLTQVTLCTMALLYFVDDTQWHLLVHRPHLLHEWWSTKLSSSTLLLLLFLVFFLVFFFFFLLVSYEASCRWYLWSPSSSTTAVHQDKVTAAKREKKLLNNHSERNKYYIYWKIKSHPIYEKRKKIYLSVVKCVSFALITFYRSMYIELQMIPIPLLSQQQQQLLKILLLLLQVPSQLL